MKIVGIIVAKHNSNRFPGKNYHIHKGKPIFMHNWELLNSCPIVDMTYIATDSQDIKRYFKNLPMAVIDRGSNISEDEQPILEVMKYCYYCLPEKYDIIITILADTISHTMDAVSSALKLMIDTDLNEVRSYDKEGKENGIIVFREKVLKQHEISSHMGMVISPGREIHYEKELEDYK